jgi:general secretion pathway protein B
MSFILDAIRRAESERQAESVEAGRVPGLHSRTGDGPPVPRAGPDPSLEAGEAMPNSVGGSGRVAGTLPIGVAGALLVAVVAVVVVVVVVAVGVGFGIGRLSPKPEPVATAVASSPTVAAPAAPPAALVSPERAERPEPRPTTLLLPTPVPAPSTMPAQPGPVAIRDLPKPSPPSSASSAVPTGVTTPAPAATPWANLPPEVRGLFPPLAIGGSIWSDDPPSRFVLVSGQVVREGESAAAGVVVERIGQRSLIVRWRGERVELPLP